MGGCPEFRNSAVSSMNAATQSILIGDVESQDAMGTATDSIFSAALDLFFEQFRAEETR